MSKAAPSVSRAPALPSRVSVHSPVELGAAIRRRRRALGLRQADVALRSGLSLPTVGAIERGKDSAQIGLVLGLARDLGLRLDVVADA